MNAVKTTALVAAFLCMLGVPEPAAGQGVIGDGGAGALQEHHPELVDLLDRLDAAHALLFEQLGQPGDPTATVEADLLARLIGVVRGDQPIPPELDRYGRLGDRAAMVIRHGRSFQQEVISILADPDVVDPTTALAQAVDRYGSQSDLALPTVPKDMNVLYDHEYALAFRTEYPELDGLMWAGHWLRLAATEPLTDVAPGRERTASLDTVTARYDVKLSDGEPPHTFPSEIPLAPAIAPGLIWLSPEAAMIWDNLSMMVEVLADILATPEVRDVQASIEATLDFFLDPELAVTDRDDWEIMALRHGIFFQGGYPLAVMTQNERNVGGHAAHLQGGRVLRAIPGMRN